MAKIGGISACIGGDYRYSTQLVVESDGTTVQIINVSTSPIGGMDGPGGTISDKEIVASLVNPTAAQLLAELRRAFKTVDHGTVARYGKPTKNFRWYLGHRDDVRGLSQKLASDALRVAKAMQPKEGK